MSDQTVAVNQEFVTLGFAAEHGVIVEHQAVSSFTCLTMKYERRGETADPTSNDYAVVDFSRVDDIRWDTFELSVADAMTGFENCLCVAIRIRVVANASVPGPVLPLTFSGLTRIPGKQLRWRYRIEQQTSRGQQSRVQKITAGNVLIEA
jgi:hypothetical protein